MENKNELETKNISIKQASKILGKSEQFIREALIEGILPIGIAMKRKNSSHYSYYISPKMLYEFIGYNIQDSKAIQ